MRLKAFGPQEGLVEQLESGVADRFPRAKEAVDEAERTLSLPHCKVR